MKKILLILCVFFSVLCVLSACDTTHEIINTEESATSEKTEMSVMPMTSEVPQTIDGPVTKPVSTPTDSSGGFIEGEMPEHTYTFFSLGDINTLIETSSTNRSDYSDKFEEYNFNIIKKNKLKLIEKTYTPFIRIFGKDKNVDEEFPENSLSIFIEPQKRLYPYSEIYFFGYESSVCDIRLLCIPEKYNNTNTKDQIINELNNTKELREIIEKGEFLDWMEDMSGYEVGIILESVDGYDFAYAIEGGNITKLLVVVEDYMLCIDYNHSNQTVTTKTPFDSIFSNDKEVREAALETVVNALKNSSDSIEA